MIGRDDPDLKRRLEVTTRRRSCSPRSSGRSISPSVAARGAGGGRDRPVRRRGVHRHDPLLLRHGRGDRSRIVRLRGDPADPISDLVVVPRSGGRRQSGSRPDPASMVERARPPSKSSASQETCRSQPWASRGRRRPECSPVSDFPSHLTSSYVPSPHRVLDVAAVRRGQEALWCLPVALASPARGTRPGDGLTEKVKSLGVRVLGPNSGGVIAPAEGSPRAFSPVSTRPSDQDQDGAGGRRHAERRHR